jgi:hypothetical protein
MRRVRRLRGGGGVNVDRYLKISTWARNRYTVNGLLTTYHGGVPTVYTLIEQAAWNKYMVEDAERA